MMREEKEWYLTKRAAYIGFFAAQIIGDGGEQARRHPRNKIGGCFPAEKLQPVEDLLRS
jgi:hypothetical protein